jgi:beta-phosphoglucomutase-like phosphatase (HAD superfamily)
VTKIKAVLFDHDGTLVNSEQLHYKMWKEILDEYSIDLGMEEYAEHYAGIPTVSNAEKMANRYSALSTHASTLVNAKNTSTQTFLFGDSFPLMLGAKESLDYFHQKNLKIAIVTGAGTDGVTATIRAHNLQKHVATVVSGDDVEFSKPAPDCYLLAIQRLGVDSSECIAIEDTENGVTAATMAKIPCLAVAHSMSKHHDFSNAMETFGNLNEARNWIANNYDFLPRDS